ncbi:SPOR domain-containing protein [Candidatus Poribacteria bacterium]
MDKETRWILKMLSEHRISVLSADRMLRALELLRRSQESKPVDDAPVTQVREEQEAPAVTPQVIRQITPAQEKPAPAEDAQVAAKTEPISLRHDKPKGRILPLILSFICCGLGQIYRGRMLKGITFITIYISLVLSVFFPPSAPLLYNFGFFILLLMWLMGMVDAYMDDGTSVERTQNLALHRLPAALSVVVVCVALIAIGMMTARNFSPVVEIPAPRARNIMASTNPERVERKNPVKKTDQNDENTVTTIYTPMPVMDTNDMKAEDDGDITVIALKLGSENGYTDYYSQEIALAAHRLEPAAVEPGTTLEVGYTIDSPVSADLVLGFSIQKLDTGRWISDPGNDKNISIEPGGGEYIREFVLPDTLAPGKYNVAWGIWDSDYSRVYDSKKSTSALTIVVPPRGGPAAISSSGNATGNPELVSIQAASLTDAGSAEKLYYRLLSEGYPARMEYSASAEGERHNVLVGEFRSEKDAAPLAEELREREGISSTIVRRRTDDGKSSE